MIFITVFYVKGCISEKLTIRKEVLMVNIFVHGLGQTPASWDKTIDNIKQLDNFYCPNLCGMLKGKDVVYSALYSSFVEYCNKFDEPINFCGLSLGSVLALNYAIENPKKVNSLVLIAAQYKMPKGLLKFQNIIFGFMPAKMFEETGFSKKDFITLSKSMLDIDFSNMLDSVSHPVLLLCGEKDKANRKSSEKLSDILKDNSFEIIENASHEVNIDNPEKLATLLQDFFMKK